jgi:2,4-dienoyl-CoA reductase-like NADH-dependent reductase (Old Yellow Enzyme family)
MSSTHERLLEPGRIGSVTTRNRVIETGASMCYWHEDDIHMSEKAKACHEALALGGVGLLVVESPKIDYPKGARWRERYRMDDDRFIEGMSELVAVIHKHGCPTSMRMWHDGPWQNPLFAPPPTFEGPPIGASAVNLLSPDDFYRDVPGVLTIQEIEEIEDKFAAAALRARKAGYDGVDINAASNHIMHNFLSPFWNRRTDIYGGNPENGARLLVSSIRKIKKPAGNDFPVSVIINGMEVGQCIGIKDENCLSADDARGVGKVSPELGEQILCEGKRSEVAPCTACATCLDQSVGMERRCRINAAKGSECYAVEPAPRKKKVVVMGGGPAGMEAARVAALRGHDVTLFEKSSKLGGLLPLAALIKGREPEDLPTMIRYFGVQLKKGGLKRRSPKTAGKRDGKYERYLSPLRPAVSLRPNVKGGICDTRRDGKTVKGDSGRSGRPAEEGNDHRKYSADPPTATAVRQRPGLHGMGRLCRLLCRGWKG